MARQRTLEYSRINIVTHPHTPDGYVQLLRQVFVMGRSIAVRGEQHLMIGHLRNIVDDDPLQGLHGQLYRFIHIDKDATWFNVTTNDVATDEDIAQIRIPDHLRPNCEIFEFVFYPRGHAFFLETHSGKRSLSPSIATKMFRALFATPAVREKFGDVEVNIFADKEHLDDILRIHQLRKLVVEVSKPNADELGKAQAQVYGRLAALKARKLKIELTAESNDSIEIDDEIRMTAQVAAAGNGKVEGYGYTENGQRTEESTLDKPWQKTLSYDPNMQTPSNALIAETEGLPGH